MLIVKVTKNYRVTIPARIRKALNIRVGDVLMVKLEGERIIFEKSKLELPKVKLGKRLSVDDIERMIEEIL